MSAEELDRDIGNAISKWERKLRELHTQSLSASAALDHDIKFWTREHKAVPKHLVEAVLTKYLERMDQFLKELKQ